MQTLRDLESWSVPTGRAKRFLESLKPEYLEVDGDSMRMVQQDIYLVEWNVCPFDGCVYRWNGYEYAAIHGNLYRWESGCLKTEMRPHVGEPSCQVLLEEGAILIGFLIPVPLDLVFVWYSEYMDSPFYLKRALNLLRLDALEYLDGEWKKNTEPIKNNFAYRIRSDES